MSLSKIRNLYRQHGHRFAINGLTFNQESYNLYNLASRSNFTSNVIVSSSLKNIGNMIDTSGSSHFSSHLLSIFGMPPPIYRPIAMLDRARNFLYNTDADYQITHLRSKNKNLSLVTEEEIEKLFESFNNDPFSKDAVQIASLETTRLSETRSLNEEEWSHLEDILTNIYKTH